MKTLGDALDAFLPGGLLVMAFDGALQLRLMAEGTSAEPSQE